jgi:D-3-phosphoglycerate dehydrogenase
MRIAVLDDHQLVVPGLDCFALLDGHDVAVLPDGEPPGDAEALVLIRERTRVDAALLDRLPRLRVISQTGRVGRNVDVDACRARGIAILEGTGSPVAPAELTWALVLAAARRIPQYAEALRRGEWQRNGLEGRPDALGVALRGRTLGIWGLGRIGSLVAGYGRAFGMRVLVWGRTATGPEAASSKEELFEQADVLSLHLRLTDETAGIVTAADLARMQESALLVNTARAELVEPGALLAALRAGRPGGAALDVFETEPPAPDDPLLALPNVVCTPHLGYVERDGYELYLGQAFRNLLDWAAGA